MIHYHGGPITPQEAALAAWTGRSAMISFAHPGQLPIAASVCRGVALDNGAFSFWKSGRPVDWPAYYDWAGGWILHPAVDWAIIPDFIDGTEEDNDALLAEWPHRKALGVPVWHLHESLDRLARLAADYPRVALGSSGEYADINSLGWWDRMGQAMGVVCDSEHRPLVKLHGLRMLRREIVESFPFSSADACTIAVNIGLDKRWTGSYQPKNKAIRAELMARNYEAQRSPPVWKPRPLQEVMHLSHMEA